MDTQREIGIVCVVHAFIDFISHGNFPPVSPFSDSTVSAMAAIGSGVIWLGGWTLDGCGHLASVGP